MSRKTTKRPAFRKGTWVEITKGMHRGQHGQIETITKVRGVYYYGITIMGLEFRYPKSELRK